MRKTDKRRAEEMRKYRRMSPGALKETILEIISCMLSPNTDIRKLAEERKKAVELVESYPSLLLSIILQPEEAVEERQLACVLLRQYVQTRWIGVKDPIEMPMIADSIKDDMRRQLPRALCDSRPKVQNMVAVLLAQITQHDFPDHWPNLMQIVCSHLHTRDQVKVNGFLCFMQEFAQMADAKQVQHLGIPVYEYLINSTQDYGRSTTKLRSKAIQVVTTLLTVPGVDTKTKAETIKPTVARFSRFLQAMLAEPYGESSDFRLKSECLKSMHAFINRYPKVVEENIKNTFPVLLEILNRCAMEYSLYLAGTKGMPCDIGEDTEPSLFNQLIVNFFSVMQAMAVHKNYLGFFDGNLHNVVYYLILYMGTSVVTEQRWKTDEEAFASADEDDEQDAQVRMAANRVLLQIATAFDDKIFINALDLALQRHYYNLVKVREETPEYYWRMHEAMIYALGSFSELVMSMFKNSPSVDFKIQEYMTHWTEMIDLCPNMVLLGRILWAGGRFTFLLTVPDALKHMSTCIMNLRNASHVLRISAVRALQLHTTNVRKNLNAPYMTTALEALFEGIMYAITTTNGTATDMALETISNLLQPPYIIQLHDGFSTNVNQRLVNLLLQLFFKNGHRTSFLLPLKDIVKSLTSIPGCTEYLQQMFMPSIIDVLDAKTPDGGNVARILDLQAAVLDLLDVMVKYSPKPLSDLLLQRGFVKVCKSVLVLHDVVVNQSAVECIRSYIARASVEIRDGVDCEGHRLALHLLDVLGYLLDPQSSEVICHRAGRLFISGMSILEDLINPRIDTVLRCCLSRLQRNRAQVVEESLISVFAFLFLYHLDPVLDRLTSIPGPQGESGLAFVMQTWLSKEYCYYGRYERNISIMALCRLMQHTISNQDTRVAYINIPSVLSNRPTRKGIRDTSPPPAGVPLLVKILKMFLHVITSEVTNLAAANDKYLEHFEDTCVDHELQDSQTSLIPECHSDKAWEDSPNQTDIEDDDDDDDETDDDDPLDAQDPVYNLKVTEYALNFLKEFAQSRSEHFNELIQQLDHTEKMVLMTAGVLDPTVTLM